ncbi:MAG: hypothetical protein F6K22_27580 [Okeania sp. SIO2F4]|uniref:hypothetical protein n=1 Tax=Okeania sp. SIO2F4 TaxID=2607790 RepID=UPI00142C46DC|nr:hypothetical protein [Okeania sp. SIO2F4]NES06243.1 hypothetical protein [Okeania sp. SIO2F4]
MNNQGTPIPEETMGSETNQSSLSAMPSVGQLSSGQVNVNDLLTIGGSWNIWKSLEGTLISGPTACGRDNRLDVFGIGLDSKLYHKCYENDQLKFDWTSLEGAFIYPPSAVSRDTNLIDVFGIAKDKQVYQKSWNGEQWSEWKSLGGVCIHGVTATSWADNRIDLFTVGTNSVIYHKYWDGESWENWQPLILEGQENWEISSTCIHTPAAVSRKVRHIDIFAVGIDKHIYHAWGDGRTWTGWENVGGPSILGISATSRSPETIDLFTISTDIVETDNHLYHRFMENNQWSEWQNLGGTCISAPAAVARGSDRLDAFVIGTKSELWQKSWTNKDGESSSENEDIGISSINKEDNPGEHALSEVAKAATIETGLNIKFGSCKDLAVGWFGTDIHPLQQLETIHQKAVREAAQAYPKGSDERQNAEYKKLQSFFAFHATEPELLTQEPPVNDKSPVAQFTLAKNELNGIYWDLRTSSLAQNNDPDYFLLTKKRLLEVLLEFDQVQSSFVDFPEYSYFKNANIPILIKVEDNLRLWRAYLNDEAITCNDLENASKNLITDVQMELGRAVEGLAKISMIFSIEPFYLFRLMVPFQVVSNLGVNQGDKRNASGTLTDLINNSLGMKWVPLWLESKIIELDDALRELDPRQENFFFHLKGGRAQATLLKDPGSGKNDWDTGIIIKPDLPAEYWYETFNKVHNLVLNKLRKFKQEFFMLINLHADDVTIEMVRNRSLEDDDLIDALDESNLLSDLPTEPGDEQGSCKAELIDIGIPRRDSIEAMEHWYHTRPYITRQVNELPIPGHLYYVDEYMAMMREALAGQSPAPHKITKRVRRLFQIMNLNNNDDPRLDDIVVQKRNEIEAKNIFPNSLAIVDIPNQPIYVTRLIPIMLKQFMDAYDLGNEFDLASMVDNSFQNTSQTIPNITIPIEVENGVQADIAKNNWNPVTHGMLLQWVALANKLSTMFELNFKNRAEFFGFGQQATQTQNQTRTMLENFVKELHNSSVFSENETEIEVQFAVCGSFAAHLHAEYAQLKTESKAQLDPVTYIELKIFAWDSGANPNIVREALIAPAVNTYLTNHPNQFNIQTGGNGEIYLFWHQQETLGNFHYRPLVVKILVEKNFWPKVAFVRGFPVLSLRDLIREYNRKAANAGEWGRIQKLKDTSEILRGMLTQFDY